MEVGIFYLLIIFDVTRINNCILFFLLIGGLFYEIYSRHAYMYRKLEKISLIQTNFDVG